MFYITGIPYKERGFDLSSLPVTETVKEKPSRGIFMIIFGFLFAGVFTLAAIGIAREITMGWAVLLMALPGVFIAYAGIRSLCSRKDISLGREYVEVTEHTLFSDKNWQEPISNYDGVLNESEYVSSGSGNSRSTYRVFTIKLSHPDPLKTVKIFETLKEDGHRERWESVAKLFNLSAIEKREGEIFSRDTDDLDKNISQQIQEGKITINEDLLNKPPKGVTISETDAQWAMEYKMNVNPIVYLIVFLIPAILAYFAFFTKKVPFFVGFIAILVILVIVFAFIATSITIIKIIITKEQVFFQNIVFGKIMLDKSLQINDIEEIRVGRIENISADGVILRGDSAELQIGTGLPKDSLKWLEAIILSKTS